MRPSPPETKPYGPNPHPESAKKDDPCCLDTHLDPAGRGFRRGKLNSSEVDRVTRSGSRRYARRPADIRSETRARCAIACATGWLQTNHPFWLMPLGGAACDSPPGVDGLLGLRLADSARQIVIDRKWSILRLKACRLARLARRSPSIVSTRQPSTLSVTAGSRSLRRCCGRGSAGRMVGVLGGQVRHGIVAFSGERFSAGEPLVDSQACPVRPGTPRGLLWKSVSRWKTSAEKDER